MKIVVSKCSDLNSLLELFKSHKDEPFTYLADTQLFRLFSRLYSCKILEAKTYEKTVGSIYTMEYIYDCGWLGGLLVRKEFRRKGIGRKLLEKALGWLDVPYSYAFVEPENTAAQKLFESVGFNAVYRRLNYRMQTSPSERRSKNESVNQEFQLSELAKTVGYKERGGIVNMGYYPIKLTEKVFDDLKNKKRVLRFGDVVAVVENSYVVDLDGYTFTFNDHILKRVSIPTKKAIIEVNPFYIKPKTRDLVGLLKNLAGKEVMIWTYEGDPIASKLALRESFGALVLELKKRAAKKPEFKRDGTRNKLKYPLKFPQKAKLKQIFYKISPKQA